MFKFLRPSLLFLGLSVLFSSLSYVPFVSRTFDSVAKLSFSDLSNFVDKYDKGIAELHFNRAVWLRDAVIPHKDLPEEADGTTKKPQSVQESTLAEGIRLLLRFLFLHIITLIVLCIILLRYVRLFRDTAFLLFKLVRKCNWRTPIRIIIALVRFSSWMVSIAWYYNSFLPVKTRLLVYPILTCVLATMFFKVGIGKKRLFNIVPLVIGFISYSAMVLTFNSMAHATNKFSLNECIILTWVSFICLRCFDIKKAGSRLKIRKDKAESERLSHEVSCLLELSLIFVLFRALKSLPIMGPLFIKRAYFTHFMSFFTLVTIIHCIIVYVADIKIKTGTPLARVKIVIVKALDSIILQVLGLPNIVSGRANHKNNANGILSKTLKRFKYLFDMIFGNIMGPIYKNEKVRFATKFSKAVPQLMLLFMPTLVSKAYFNYCTLITPLLKFLTLDESSLKAKILAIILLIISEAARCAINSTISHIISFKTIQRTIMLILMDHTMVFLNSVM
ncbi:uncharacterized protein BEWA_033100 [Theileria equi strain WA]|uniref:Membrane protein, putative n=1 Tax=Theileria equi strain WA TaxID=1537102 RepID=L0AY03_THEEQ|nr:uncharacterized protein BEWA_033100 [Theileria equi strain WA]AFZ80457.1 membrane protein, putative [Theileria equi strain WA]|eukprot:XP_004830123.1 uncharacterized protein BEWA_033100 [Theileria equi strain WA]